MSTRTQRWQSNENPTERLRDGLPDLGAGAGAKSPRRRASKREPLVLLHPFSLCSAVWQPILPALQAHYDVHTLTIPGHHGSDPLPEDYRYSIETSCEMLERQLDALGIDKAHLVGNSLGGWLAIELARRGRALSVTALAPGGGWEQGSRDHRRLVRRFRTTKQLLNVYGPLAVRLTRFATGRAMLLRDAVANPARLRPSDARRMIERAWRCQAYDPCVAALPGQPLSEPFDELPCPIRIVWGDQDRLLPLRGYSERWRRVLPGAEWVILEGVGHVQMYDDPRGVAAAILSFTRRARQPAAEWVLAAG